VFARGGVNQLARPDPSCNIDNGNDRFPCECAHVYSDFPCWQMSLNRFGIASSLSCPVNNERKVSAKQNCLKNYYGVIKINNAPIKILISRYKQKKGLI
jgi:hypothetical protein